jgi:hypothetical protein
MTKTQALIRDPDREFREPDELLKRSDLSVNEKLLVLRSWHADLVEMQKATEENMADLANDRDDSCATMTKVAAAIFALDEQKKACE